MEAKLFTGTPNCTTASWYAGRDRAPHLDEPLHRSRLEHAAHLAWLAAKMGAATVSDLGAGDGGLLSLVAHHFTEAWGYDLQQTNVEGAIERGVKVMLADFLAGPVRFGDLSACTEVLEHLADPHAFLRCVESRFLVASAPVFETVDTHYEYHLWAWDIDGFQALITQAGYGIVQHNIVETSQLVLAARVG